MFMKKVMPLPESMSRGCWIPSPRRQVFLNRTSSGPSLRTRLSEETPPGVKHLHHDKVVVHGGEMRNNPWKTNNSHKKIFTHINSKFISFCRYSVPMRTDHQTAIVVVARMGDGMTHAVKNQCGKNRSRMALDQFFVWHILLFYSIFLQKRKQIHVSPQDLYRKIWLVRWLLALLMI